ncbi:MAG: outer membrane lipid asymmetry maintenance protein MlaD [Nitrospirota bacterium]|nr:outer membrane lipid asymmetry maintenance protein MlaD [Nitrospirota bacterium]
MKKFDLELAVGVFLLIGILSIGYLSVKLGNLDLTGKRGYIIRAEFEKAGGIKPGAVVEIAGVEVGSIKNIHLNNNAALIELAIDDTVKIHDDAIASIKTKGLIGEKFIQITPGGSDKILPSGGKIRDTESAVDIEELISKFVFGKV